MHVKQMGLANPSQHNRPRYAALSYVWGDNDPDARASQIEQMDSIFGRAQVTLVAADGV